MDMPVPLLATEKKAYDDATKFVTQLKTNRDLKNIYLCILMGQFLI
jgi:hypothetical protein